MKKIIKTNNRGGTRYEYPGYEVLSIHTKYELSGYVKSESGVFFFVGDLLDGYVHNT